MVVINSIRFHSFRKKVKKNGVKGLISKNEAKFLFNSVLNANGSCVEIGSFQGYSTLFMAYGAMLKNKSKITAIDPHLGLILDDKKIETYDIFIKNIEQFNLRPYVDMKRLTSEQAVRNWNQPIAFLWIDGDHDYEAVKLDYISWEPYLVKGGIIAFHDAGLKTFWPGPRKLVDEIELTKKFKPFQYVEGIAWAIKK